jgi:hypothetical protein
MAGPAPNTRNWHARENAHKPAGLHLIVTGEVEVSATSKIPELAEGPHAGNVLPLDLTIADSGEGEDVKVWMGAYLHKEVTADEFERVQVRWDGQVVATVPVIDDREYDTLLAKQAQAQNSVAKVVTKKPAARKAVERVVAAVEDAVGDLAKGARKALKRVLKTAPKKPARKAATAASRKSAKKTTAKTGKKTAKSARKFAKTSARTSVRTSARTSTRKAGRPVKKLAKKAAPKKAKKANKSKKRR